VALIRSSKALDSLKLHGDEAIGVEIVRTACFAPAAAIANNCGKIGGIIAEKIAEKEGSYGYNGLTDQFSDLVKDGVIDPVLVTISALIYAASVAGMLITIAAIITDKPEPKGAAPAPAPGMPGMNGMGGMGGFGGMM
jgi:chaperonin GroEL